MKGKVVYSYSYSQPYCVVSVTLYMYSTQVEPTRTPHLLYPPEGVVGGAAVAAIRRLACFLLLSHEPYKEPKEYQSEPTVGP